MPGLFVNPTNLAREAIVTRLANTTTGFNATYATSLANHVGAPAMSIDFTGAAKNFFRGDIDPEALEMSSAFSYPLLTVYGKNGVNSNIQKFQRFAGIVHVGARFMLSSLTYKKSQALQDFEVWPDAIEDAFLQVLHSPANQNWPMSSVSSVIYNGDVAFERGFPFEGGTGWLQLVSFLMTLEVVIT